jgi:putative heme iron utilization protein
VDIAAWCCLCILCVVMGFYLKHLNRKQGQHRVALGLPAELEDISVMTPEQAEAYKRRLTERMNAQGLNAAQLYENAFDDLTDFE